MRSVTAATAALLVLAACTGPTPDPADPSGTAPTAEDVVAVPCAAPAGPPVPPGTTLDLNAGRGDRPVGLGPDVRDVAVHELVGDATALAAAVAEALDPCADGEPVVAAGGLGAVVVAGALAAAEGRPLVPPVRLDVVADPTAGAVSAAAATLDLLTRWDATTVLVAGEDDVAAWTALVVEAAPGAAPLLLPAAAAPPDPAGEPLDAAEAPPAAPVDPAVPALQLLPAGTAVTVVASDEVRASALAARVVAAGWPEPGVRVVADGPEAPPVGGGGVAGGTLWLAAPDDPIRLVVAAAAAGARDEALLVVDPTAPVEVLRRAGTLRRTAPERLVLVGGEGAPGRGGPAARAATTAWALDVALHTDPLPWGGWLPLDGTRIVALYGTPGAPALGALGQQDLDATFDRVRETAARYDLDGLRIVPGFDLIVTVASAAPGPADDYSQRVSIERVRPLVDRARAEGMAVFIDLQPGRTDFLTQAQEYEELLLEPHVFLALDPEWRLRPDQFHLRQIGSVPAEEVQRVADWLAELVRRERLPQKGFMLHQFLLEMLPDRDTVVVPPELVGIVHVDGQGAVATKERTFRIMAEGADPQWHWGWKQFLRIDTPAVMDPADVIDRLPLPVVITYQ